MITLEGGALQALERASDDEFTSRVLDLLDAQRGSPTTRHPEDLARVRASMERARELGLSTERQVAAFVVGAETSEADAACPWLPLSGQWNDKTSTGDVLAAFPEPQEWQAAAATIDERFTDHRAGAACATCAQKRSWVEVHLRPWPPAHLPGAQPAYDGEASFEDQYEYTLRASDGSETSGKVSFSEELKLKVPDLPFGLCTLSLRAPRFKEDTKARWRREWSSKAAAACCVFDGLVTGRVHCFMVVNELWYAALFTARMMDHAIGHPKLVEIRQLLAGARETACVMGDSLCAPEQMKHDADRRFVELFDYDKVWDFKRPFATKPLRSLEDAYSATKPLGVDEVPDHVLGHWHSWGPWEYYYDCWANLFFGFAGREAGFTLQHLHDGATAAQRARGLSETWGNLKSGTLALGTFQETEQDVEAIDLGFHLHEKGMSVTPETLIEAVTRSAVQDRRPLSYNSVVDARVVRRARCDVGERAQSARQGTISRDGAPAPHFSQGDPRWGAHTLGRNTTIKRSGCAMSSVAMVLAFHGRAVDPSTLDAWLDTHGGYSGDMLVFQRAIQYGETAGDRLSYRSIDRPSVHRIQEIIADRVARNLPTIAQVDYGRDADARGNHFVVIVGVDENGNYIMNDPASKSGSGAENPTRDNLVQQTARGGGYNIIRLIEVDPI